jgi:flagellum-specific ATP synthase
VQLDLAIDPYLQAIRSGELTRKVGRLIQFYGLVLESDGPDVFLGEQCKIYSDINSEPVIAEVVGIKNGRVILMPYGVIGGIRYGSEVIGTGKPVLASVGPGLLGRVVDGFGQPLDDKGDLTLEKKYPVYGEKVNPLSRPDIDSIMQTGIKCIDSLLTLGKGQRVGIFAGSGVGKSTLLGMLARNIDADINVVALIGERGREVLDFIQNNLGEQGLAKSVVVVATSDQSALERTHAALYATAIAEYFRDCGKHVCFMMDSVTRYAMAQREIGLAIGEPPTARGYTPSVFASLPKLLERCGGIKGKGVISAIYTVLVEGDDVNDPIADNLRAILDGHIVLSRDNAQKGLYPAIDLQKSNSRLMKKLLSRQQQENAIKLLSMMSTYHEAKDLLDVGAYKAGVNNELDEALKLMPEIKKFLYQNHDECFDFDKSISQISAIIN